MKHEQSKTRKRMKAILLAVAALAVGIGLITLSRIVHASAQKEADEPVATSPDSSAEAPSEATTAPAGTPATKPADVTAPATSPADMPSTPDTTTSPPGGRKPTNPRQAAGERLAGLLLLFGLMAVGLCLIGAGWVVYDIRRSRPAWKTQTKYPVMEKKKHKRGKS